MQSDKGPNGSSLEPRGAQARVDQFERRTEGLKEGDRFERELQESRERLDLAIMGSKAAIWDLEYTQDESSRTITAKVYISPQFKEFLGYEDHEFPNTLEAWQGHVLPEDVATVGEAARDLLEGIIEVHEVEYRALHKNGGIRWIYSRGRIRRTEGGKVVRWTGLNWDVTERKKAEDELKRLVAILEETPDFISTADLKGNVLYMNRAGRAVLGIGQDDPLTGKRACQFYPAWTKRIIEEEALPVALKEGAWHGDKTAILASGEQENPVSQVILSHKDALGKVQYLSTIVRDISHLKKVEAALRESEERHRHLSERLEAMVKEQVAKLRQAERMAEIGQMISTVAHEIRNPLNNITLGLDTLQLLLQENEACMEVCEEIQYGVTILREVFAEVLDYARPVKLACSLCTIDEVIIDALKRIPDASPEVTFHAQIDGGDRQLLLDLEKMTRVLVNLISNALDAMPHGGTCTIASAFTREFEEEALVLTVCDTGAGMDEHTLGQIEKPFFSTKAAGTGLGVPICRKIVDAHNGRLSIQSKPNEGTTVKIFLPASAPPSEAS